MQVKPTRYDFEIVISWDDGTETKEVISGTKYTVFSLDGIVLLSIHDGQDEIYTQHFSADTKIKRIGKTRKVVQSCES